MGVALDLLTKEVEKLKSDDEVSSEAMGSCENLEIEPEHSAFFDAKRFAAKDETLEALSGLSIAELAS